MTRRGSPKIARISPDGDVERQLERFKSAVSGAADAAEGAAQKQAKQQEKASEDLGKAVRSFVFQDVGRSAVSALGQAGSGPVDAAFAATRGLAQALPALGGTFAQSQGIPFGVGALAGAAGGALLERTVGPEAQARERAIAETQALFAPAAAQGQAITKEEMSEVLSQALQLNRQLANLDGQVRAASQGVGF